MAGPPPANDDPTTLLHASTLGDDGAARRLLPHIYDELHHLARRYRRGERSALTLSTTGLVHEAYLKLVNQEQSTWRDRQHFVALASRAIRQILIDYARGRNRYKRRGAAVHIPVEGDLLAEEQRPEHLLALDEALAALENYDPRLARLVELRYFGGMTVGEAAEELGLALRSAERAWMRARAFLLAHLCGELDTTKGL